MVFTIFIQIIIQCRTFCEQTGDADQTPRSSASDLGLHCFPMSHKKVTRLIWVNTIPVYNLEALLTILSSCK